MLQVASFGRVTQPRRWTALLVVAAFVQLTGFGLLPSGTKIFGDVLLLAVMWQGARQGLLRPLGSDVLGRVVFGLALAYLGLALALMARSLASDGMDLPTFQLGRRWIIGGVYYLLATSLLASRLDYRLLYRSAIAFALIGSVSAIAASRFGVSLYGVDGSEGIQSGVRVVKVFGSHIYPLYIGVCLSIYLWLTARRSVGAGVCVCATGIGSLVVLQFRSMWLSMAAFGLACGALSLWTHRDTVLVKQRVLTMGVTFALLAGACAILLSSELEERLAWVGSAQSDVENNYGTFDSRLRDHWARWELIERHGDPTEVLFGLGYVQEFTRREALLGTFTVSNDFGWAEFMLTSGYVGTSLFVILWLAVILRLAVLAKRSNPVALALPLWWIAIVQCFVGSPFLFDQSYILLSWILAWAISDGISQPDELRNMGYRPLCRIARADGPRRAVTSGMELAG